MYPSSASPPVTGAMSREHLPLGSSADSGQGPISPSSLSFSKQPLPRNVSGRPPYNPAPGSSPFIPGSLERDNVIPSPTGQQPPHIIKRYSSSLSQRGGRVGSAGSSGDGGGAAGSVPGSIGHSHNLLRRTSTRESGLRHSREAPASGTPVTVPDDDDIQSFLKTLDALPQPPSLAAQSASSRARLPSTSSSLSNTSIPQSPSPLQTSTTSAQPPSTFAGRAPMTRKQVDDALKRMTGSFITNTRTLEQSSVMPPSAEMSRTQSQSLLDSQGGSSSRPDVTPSNRSSSGTTPSVGLLTASRPSPVPRRVSPASLSPATASPRPIIAPHQASAGSGTSSLGRSASVKKNSPLSGVPLLAPQPRPHPPAAEPALSAAGPDTEALETALPASPPRTTSPNRAKGAARSLPLGPAPLAEDSPIPSRSQRPSGFLSPQPTGSGIRAESARPGSAQRRGPVLLRGGFDSRSYPKHAGSSPGQRQSVSPSHSPIRDFSRLTSPRMTGEEQAERALGSWRRFKSVGGEAAQPSHSQQQAPATSRRQSDGAGDVLETGPEVDRPGRGSGGAGQQTAPSSLGRMRGQEDDIDPEDQD